MPTTPLADQPYHRLARTERYSWGKQLAELVLAVVLWALLAVVATMLVVALCGGGSAKGLMARGGPGGVLVVGLGLAMLIPAARLAARCVGRRPGTLSSVAGRLRWGWLGRCLGIAAAVCVAQLAVIVIVAIATTPAIDTASEVSWPGWGTFLPLALAVLVSIPLQAAGEEYLVRGTLMQSLGAWGAPAWAAIAISAAVFAAMHGLHPEVLVAIGGMGLVTGWLTIRTGGLEAAIALHAANNTLALLLEAALGGGQIGLSDVNSGLSWWGVGASLSYQLAFAAIILRLLEPAAPRVPAPTRPTTAVATAAASVPAG